jgi:hypothetical protein
MMVMMVEFKKFNVIVLNVVIEEKSFCTVTTRLIGTATRVELTKWTLRVELEKERFYLKVKIIEHSPKNL